jgi:hypothetical protein
MKFVNKYILLQGGNYGSSSRKLYYPRQTTIRYNEIDQGIKRTLFLRTPSDLRKLA